jgi:hypothetical protein
MVDFKALESLGRIRNVFAHDWTSWLDFNDPRVTKELRNLPDRTFGNSEAEDDGGYEPFLVATYYYAGLFDRTSQEVDRRPVWRYPRNENP